MPRDITYTYVPYKRAGKKMEPRWRRSGGVELVELLNVARSARPGSGQDLRSFGRLETNEVFWIFLNIMEDCW